MLELQEQYEQTYGPGNYIPPVKTTFWSFRIMVGSGMLMILLAMYGTYLTWRKKLELPNGWYYKLMLFAISLPFIGNTAGWIMTEMGRQPWTVFGLLTTEDSVSPGVPASQVLFSFLSFTTIYLILMGITIYLFARTARKGPEGDNKEQAIEVDPFGQEGGNNHVTK